MATLKEIKARILSVRNTLKITSAMKMVASAKLHRVQGLMSTLTYYEARLQEITSRVAAVADEVHSPYIEPHVVEGYDGAEPALRRVALVAIASDSSLCGAFNANVVRLLHQHLDALRREGFRTITLFAVGEKMVQAARKIEAEDVTLDLRLRHGAGAPTWEGAVEAADLLMTGFVDETFDRVEVLYNHFYSTGHQAPVVRRFLPALDLRPECDEAGVTELSTTDYLIEPQPETLLEELIPRQLRLRLYATEMDAATAEHAARMVAMQTATDNANELLETLSLTYNKQRQQAITAELADIANS